MNKKTLTLGFVGLMGIAIALAYAAGKQSNQLSQEQMSFDQHKVQWEFPRLTTQIWDQVMSHLTTWAKNHESRLQVFADNPNLPNLTEEQTSFNDLTADKHGNMLNAEMRNGLAQKLTFTITNHEMRLRALEDKPVEVKEDKPVESKGACVGEWIEKSPWSCFQNYAKTNGKVGLYINLRERCHYYLRNTYNSWSHPDNFDPRDPYADRRCELKYVDKQWKFKSTEPPSYNSLPFEHRWLYDGDWKDLISCSTAWGVTNNSCSVWCYELNQYSCSSNKWCEWSDSTPNRGSCDSFDKYECWKKAALGCSWDENFTNTQTPPPSKPNKPQRPPRPPRPSRI